MTRFFSLMVALWAVVLSSPLCVSGVVMHQCETCAKDCSHEAACPQDPCSLKVSKNETVNSLSSQVHFDATFLLCSCVSPVALAFSMYENVLTAVALFPPNTQPYPLGAFPLLI
jgi:hypothetical protein